MRELHYVTRADEDALVVETADGLEQFRLPVDAALRAVLREPAGVAAARPRPVAVTLSAPAIGPREIQVRVRAGESPQEIADAHSASLDFVLRFAGPVLAERDRVANEARRARARRSTTDGQPVVFGDAVDERFGAHGIDPGTVRWDARRREDGQWVVSAHWLGGDADRTAEWTFQLSGRTVAPLDDTAADLLSDRPIRPLVTVAPARANTLAPALAPGVVAFPAMADAHTGEFPRIEEVFDQEAFGDDDPEPPAALHEHPTDVLPDSLFDDVPEDAPALPLAFEGRESREGRHAEGPRRRMRLTDLGVAGRRETDEEKAARAHVPSWDDILLGVRRKND